jgi:hypothetical protein
VYVLIGSPRSELPRCHIASRCGGKSNNGGTGITVQLRKSDLKYVLVVLIGPKFCRHGAFALSRSINTRQTRRLALRAIPLLLLSHTDPNYITMPLQFPTFFSSKTSRTPQNLPQNVVAEPPTRRRSTTISMLEEEFGIFEPPKASSRFGAAAHFSSHSY